jgi:hypothetical protein
VINEVKIFGINTFKKFFWTIVFQKAGKLHCFIAFNFYHYEQDDDDEKFEIAFMMLKKEGWCTI